MKHTFIVYKENRYPINICRFYKDCVHVMDYDPMTGLDEFVAPNGSYEYVEEDVEVFPVNYQTYLDNEQVKQERRIQAIELAQSTFPHKRPENPYKDQMGDYRNFPHFADYILDGHWEDWDDSAAYPFFDREVYKQYRKEREEYHELWHSHLDFFLSKIEDEA